MVGARDAVACELTRTDAHPEEQVHPHGDFDPDQEYEIDAIIDETKQKYLIRWKDNSVTGERYNDSWEPKDLANRFAVEDWKDTKRQRSEYLCRSHHGRVGTDGRQD